jgi:hypothetical protein
VEDISKGFGLSKREVCDYRGINYSEVMKETERRLKIKKEIYQKEFQKRREEIISNKRGIKEFTVEEKDRIKRVSEENGIEEEDLGLESNRRKDLEKVLYQEENITGIC